MPKSIFALIAAALLLGACSTTQTQAVVAPPPPPPTVQATSYMVFFDWDRSNLSAQAMSTIAQAAQAYKTSGSVRLTATGHTDTSGPDDYNMALSLRRANTVKDGLVSQGVPATAINVVGVGKAGLLVPTGDGVREPQNRRVEVVVGDGQMSSTTTIWSDPRGYCKALTDKYRQLRNFEVQNQEATAMYRCEQGDYAAGIPVLEDALIRASIPLPQPGFRWPGKSYAPS